MKVSYSDLKLLADCYFRRTASGDPSVMVPDGFVSASKRLERAGFIERNPQDENEIRITETGNKVVDRLIATLDRSVEFYLS